MCGAADKRILLIGGGGHCRSVADIVLSLYGQVGIIEGDAAQQSQAGGMGLPVVGTDIDLPRLFTEGWNEAFITVGSVGDTALRRRLFEKVISLGYHVPAIIDPTAVIARDVEVRDGTFVGKRAVLNSGSTVGQCAIVNTGAIIEHDCTIGNFAHISPGAVLCGEVVVGEGTHIGAGSAVRQQLKIGRGVMVGMGSVVVKNIPDNVRAWGNPCRVVD